MFVRFFQTIVLAKPISKLFLVSVWDSLFYPNRVGHSLGVDSALVLLLLPYRFFVADYWHHGVPLWNQFSGFGMPLLADPQAFVFSPIFAFFYMFPSVYNWNVTLIAELAIAALCTFFLCRELELGSIESLVGSLLFAFCPWVQWQIEILGPGICLTPFVFWLFARAARRTSPWNAVLAGIAAAIDILSSHPEASFVTIIFACLLMCLVAYYHDRSRFNFLAVLFRIGLAGIVAFGLSAPLLFPFAEFLRNCESYKFDRAAPTDISWQALIANYLYPFFSVSSPYFGPVSWLGIVGALFFPNRNNRFSIPLLTSLLISILIVAKSFPLSLLFLISPLSVVQPMYCLPAYLLLVSVVSALGLGGLFSGTANGSKSLVAASFCFILVLIFIPMVYSPWHHDNSQLVFDQTLQISSFHTRIWLLNVVCLTVMVLLWRMTANGSTRMQTIGRSVFLGLGVLNLGVVSYFSLPTMPSFQYPANLPINIAAPNASRFISLGDHLFRPNTNLVYKLPTIRVHNPLFPKGYLALMKACGAQFDDFNQYFPATISRLLDITATRTILSEQPLLDEDVTSHSLSKSSTREQVVRQVSYADSMTLSNIELFIDTKQRDVYCSLVAIPNSMKTDSYHLDCRIEDPVGTSICFIESQPISGVAGRQAITFSACLPSSVKHWTLSLKLLCDKNASLVRPTSSGTNFGSVNTEGACQLATSEQPNLFTKIANDRFKPVAHYGGSIVAYENKTALTRCFFAKRVEWVKERGDALDYLQKHTNELGEVIVLEDFQKRQFEDEFQKIRATKDSAVPSIFDQSGSIKKLGNSSEVSDADTSSILNLQVECAKTSLLFVSDLYYPGWKVFLDGHEKPMFRANSLFRAVQMPPGKHHIWFDYQPISFALGTLLFLATSIIILVYIGLTRYKHV